MSNNSLSHGRLITLPRSARRVFLVPFKPRTQCGLFLLKSDGGTPQNMRFNVFVILVCSIYDKNNLWHVKSWRFILTVEVVSKTALPRRCLVVCLSRLIYTDYMQDRQGQTKTGGVRQSRNLLDPFTARDTACRWAKWSVICTKLVRMWNKLGIS